MQLHDAFDHSSKYGQFAFEWMAVLSFYSYGRKQGPFPTDFVETVPGRQDADGETFEQHCSFGRTPAKGTKGIIQYRFLTSLKT